MVRSCEENYGYDAENNYSLFNLRSSSRQLSPVQPFHLDNLGSSCQQLSPCSPDVYLDTLQQSFPAQIFTYFRQPSGRAAGSPVQPNILAGQPSRTKQPTAQIFTWIAQGRAAGSCRLSSPDHRYRTQPSSCHVQNSWDPGSLLQVQKAVKQTSGAQSTIGRSYEDSLNPSIITTALILCLRGLNQC